MPFGKLAQTCFCLALNGFFLSYLSASPAPKALPAKALRNLLASQDALNDLDFDRSEGLARKVIAKNAEHPLPRIFLQGALLSRIQEKISSKEDTDVLIRSFLAESDSAVDLAQRWQASGPGPEAKLYLGNALGARGLVHLYQGSYLAAYRDGQKAATQLREAIEQDPKLYEAYLGLGQYEYYCGRMSGLLRLVVNLRGNTANGIAMLKTSAEKGVCSAIPARSALARILSEEEIDFLSALPYVKALRKRYPSNYYYAQYALSVAKGLGWQHPQAKQLAGSVYKQWDRGWRPPAYSTLNIAQTRLAMVQAEPLRQVKELAPQD